MTGVLYIMALVNTMILQKETNESEANFACALVPMKYDSFDTYDVYGSVSTLVWLVYLISVFIQVIIVIGKLMSDKSSRMRENMRVMGLNDASYYMAYFISYAIRQFVISFGCPLVIWSEVYPTTSYLLLALHIFLFSLALFPLAIITAYQIPCIIALGRAVFTSPLVAKIMGVIIFCLMTVLPYPYVQMYAGSKSFKFMGSLLPQMAYSLGLEVIGRAEATRSFI